jgi:hypothetical protein
MGEGSVDLNRLVREVFADGTMNVYTYDADSNRLQTTDENRSVNHNMASIAFRYFPGPRVWLQAGLGWANFSVDCRDDALSADCGKQSESGGAAVVSLGYEILQRRHLTFDLSLRAGSAKFEEGRSDMASLQLGVNWYCRLAFHAAPGRTT